MSSTMYNMIAMIVLVQLTNRIDFTIPENIMYARMTYTTCQLIILGIAYYVLNAIRTVDDRTELKYTEPTPPFSNEPGKRVITTVAEYDEDAIKQVIKQTLITLGVIGVMHWKWGFVQPLVFQSFFPLKQIFDNKAVKIHLLGKKAEGELQRPWKQENPFAGMFDANGLAEGSERRTQVTNRNEERREKRKLEKEAKKKE